MNDSERSPIRNALEQRLKELWNSLIPCKILNYRTPQEVFLEEVKKSVDLESVQFHIAI